MFLLQGRNIFILFVLICIHEINAQQKVTFYASDSLKITADLYVKDYNLPFILLFHQGDYSRGEYNEIAPKLMKLGYNCLAVDLRSGGKVNFIKNETAAEAFVYNKPRSYYDARQDIDAAIKYIKAISKKQVILFGSSYSASLCLLVAKDNDFVKAVIACSPGEYFRPEIIIRERMVGFQKPVFITSTSLEYEYVNQITEGINKRYLTLISPSDGKGVHGAKAFWKSSETHDEFWLQLVLFFKEIRYS